MLLVCGEGRGEFEGGEAAGIANLGSYEAAVECFFLTVIGLPTGKEEVRRRILE